MHTVIHKECGKGKNIFRTGALGENRKGTYEFALAETASGG
jgi:hypothetical protein